ncbi:hypothetical protein C0Z16_24810 [Paraburkholderia rhynchosiae]|uniref:Uncharacterized protein n=1 Tax=Paraburkholderia rhynchosiae TaxID=487049 RepID=A0ABX4V2U0_9BURK|nr:hypothetical protein C0Z16_24810 [Paraburkholderia rhynchosiae]
MARRPSSRESSSPSSQARDKLASYFVERICAGLNAGRAPALERIECGVDREVRERFVNKRKLVDDCSRYRTG